MLFPSRNPLVDWTGHLLLKLLSLLGEGNCKKEIKIKSIVIFEDKVNVVANALKMITNCLYYQKIEIGV